MPGPLSPSRLEEEVGGKELEARLPTPHPMVFPALGMPGCSSSRRQRPFPASVSSSENQEGCPSFLRRLGVQRWLPGGACTGVTMEADMETPSATRTCGSVAGGLPPWALPGHLSGCLSAQLRP